MQLRARMGDRGVGVCIGARARALIYASSDSERGRQGRVRADLCEGVKNERWGRLAF